MKKIFDGEKHAGVFANRLKRKNKNMRHKPRVVSILIGENIGNEKYTSLKKKKARELGINFEVVRFRSNTAIKEIITKIKSFNEDNEIGGIMIQLPLPKNFTTKDVDELIGAIDPKKDVDGMRGDSPFVAPVVRAIMHALRTAGCKKPMKAVVVGDKGFVGKKVLNQLESKGYKVTGADADTNDISGKCKKADILVSCAGSPGLITSDMVKDGVVVVDVGAPKGDVDFESVSEKAAFITPVPGGIGPLTIVFLMNNLFMKYWSA